MTSKRNRIFAGLLAIYVAGIALLMYRMVADLDPRYRESAEESLVETAHVMAALVEQDVHGGEIDTARVASLFDAVRQRVFDARIFSVTKQRVDLRMYVVDAQGRVLYDSTGQQTGADFSRWRDVVLALRGQYGARTTEDPASPHAVMFVAAPVRWQGRIVGAVSVGKPVQSYEQFVEAARRKTITIGVFAGAAILVLAIAVSIWLTRPFGMVTDYVRFLRSQPRFSFRRAIAHGLAMLREAYDEMRDALAGRNYVADYVQTLTHELKSPLSAIRGAAELLNDPAMSMEDRARFLGHVKHETERIQQVVDRMMELTALESRRSLDRVQRVGLRQLASDVVDTQGTAASGRGVGVLLVPGEDIPASGDPLLLRLALGNLVANAIDFSPAGGQVRVSVTREGRQAIVRVTDEGPGIPDYAREKVFEKFYSLARPHSMRKSTGLGLSFVQRIAALHRGRVRLDNGSHGGAIATFSLPASR